MALLVVGGIALFGALTSGPAGPKSPAASSSSATSKGAKPVGSAKSSTSTRPPTVEIRVTGAPTRVYVLVPNSAAGVRENGVLGTGEYRQYDDPRLDVIVANTAAVEVKINGKVQQKSAAGGRQNWIAQRG